MLVVVVLVALVEGSLPALTQMTSGTSTRATVNTTIGLVYGGNNITLQGTSYYYYLGIPYAKAPRFQDPEPHPRQDFTTVALSRPPLCPQWVPEENRVRGKEERCLHVSVFTRQAPGTRSDLNTNLSPVLFVTVNNRFMSTEPVLPDFFLDNGLVVVTVSYRVGALGFLSTGDTHAPGNYGLLDLEEALEWVRNNIEEFGGDPQRVTLMGHGAGAALVAHLLLNPRITDKKMITGAITMSGSPLCPWSAPLSDPLHQTRRLAEALQCPSEDIQAMMDCLRREPFERIITKHQELYDQAPWVLPPLVAPVVDAGLRAHPAIPMGPEEALKQGNFTRPIPIVSGIVQEEAARLFAEMFKRDLAEDVTGHPPAVMVEHLLPTVVKSVARFCNHEDEIIALIRYHYFRSTDPGNAEGVAKATIQVMSDLLYNECQLKWSNLYREISGAAVFNYVFSYKGSLSTLDPIVGKLDEKKSGSIITALRRSVAHGDDLLYAFKDLKSLHTEERTIQNELNKMISDFAKTSSSPRTGWNSAQQYADYKNYLDISLPPMERRRFRDDDISFLNYVMALSKTPEEGSMSSHDVREAEGQDYELIMWILVGVAIFLFLAFLLAVVLFVRQKKKTTFVTR